jgi:purine-binding chemotaxis protein CheW
MSAPQLPMDAKGDARVEGLVLHVLFRVGDAEYVLPASEVLQMESYSGATAVPGTAPYVAGLVQVRGRVVPVIDLRARFGLPALAPTLDTRVVIVQRDERTVGLVVDSAREVVQLAPGALKPPPDVLASSTRSFVKAIAQAGQRLVMLIDFARVIGEEQAHGGR